MKRKNCRIMVFDIETAQFENVNEKAITFAFANFFDGQRHELVESRERFDEKIIELTTSDEYYVLYAHNLMFDFSYCIRPLLRAGFVIKPVENNGKLLFVKVGKESVKSRKKLDDYIEYISFESYIEFRDSYSLFQTSLKSLGQFVGLEKIEHEKKWAQELTLDDIAYVERDCEIVWKALAKFKEFYSLELGKPISIEELPPTTASCAWRLFREFNSVSYIDRKTKKEKKICPWILKNKELNNFFINSFYLGGRVELFDMSFAEHISYYDINSLYPYVMISNPFHRPPYAVKDFEEADLDSDKTVGFFAEIDETNESVPLIGTKYDSGLYFPAMKKKSFIFREEYEYLKSRSVPIVISETLFAYNPPEYPFSYLMRYYEEKQRKGPMSYFYKILMNSTYGRFGIDSEKEELKILPIEEADLTDPRYEIIDLTEDFIKFHEMKDMKFDRNTVIASKITALARLEITRWIHKLIENGVRVYYCDTDSIVCAENNILPLGKELGQFKKEHEFLWFQGLGNKEYIGKISESDYILKLKGVHNESIENLFEYHDVGVEQHHVSKLKTLLRKGWLDEPRNLMLIKRSATLYHKRRFLEDLSSEPLKSFSELKSVEENNAVYISKALSSLKQVLGV